MKLLVHSATGPENATRAALAPRASCFARSTSGMSSKARGIDGDGMELCPPAKLIELAAWADTTLTD